MTTTPLFSSALAPLLERYVNLKRSLGRRFATATWTLRSLDRFLRDHAGTHKDLTWAAFHGWCQTHEHLDLWGSPGQRTPWTSVPIGVELSR